MPALLETQRALSAQLLGSQAAALEAAALSHNGLALRLSIYRNTCVSTLVNALRLSYPAVQRLVGGDFFEAAARQFIDSQRPHSAYLNDYGGAFAQFLSEFAPAATVPYLGEVAQLEWAVNCALHAAECVGLDLSRLAALDQALLPRVCLVPHPGMSLLQFKVPADLIWRAVLDQDQDAMASIDLASAPIWVLIERDEAGVQVRRLSHSHWTFSARLCAGVPFYQSLADAADAQLNALLAQHLASGRFIDFRLTDLNPTAQSAGERGA